MCYGDPTESLAIARARLTHEQWEKFEADFGHFCAYSGLTVRNMDRSIEPDLTLEKAINRAGDPLAMAWAKWAYLCGKGL
jgi:hypothetical protein